MEQEALDKQLLGAGKAPVSIPSAAVANAVASSNSKYPAGIYHPQAKYASLEASTRGLALMYLSLRKQASRSKRRKRKTKTPSSPSYEKAWGCQYDPRISLFSTPFSPTPTRTNVCLLPPPSQRPCFLASSPNILVSTICAFITLNLTIQTFQYMTILIFRFIFR